MMIDPPRPVRHRAAREQGPEVRAPLRAYQSEAVEHVLAAHHRGERSWLVSLPTGGVKTIVAGAVKTIVAHTAAFLSSLDRAAAWKARSERWSRGRVADAIACIWIQSVARRIGLASHLAAPRTDAGVA